MHTLLVLVLPGFGVEYTFAKLPNSTDITAHCITNYVNKFFPRSVLKGIRLEAFSSYLSDIQYNMISSESSIQPFPSSNEHLYYFHNMIYIMTRLKIIP
jgi:hypothetical protein